MSRQKHAVRRVVLGIAALLALSASFPACGDVETQYPIGVPCGGAPCDGTEKHDGAYGCFVPVTDCQASPTCGHSQCFDSSDPWTGACAYFMNCDGPEDCQGGTCAAELGASAPEGCSGGAAFRTGCDPSATPNDLHAQGIDVVCHVDADCPTGTRCATKVGAPAGVSADRFPGFFICK